MINSIIGKLDIERCKNEFQSRKPFKYLVIDNFLPIKKANNLLKSFPKIESEKWIVGYDKENNPIKFAKDNPFEKKLIAISDRNKFPSNHKKIFHFFNSQIFLNLIKDLTGINNLLIDTTGRHAGLRGMLEGSYQHIHSDAMIHPDTGLRKRLSVILYLNKEWDESMGGSLELWDDNMTNCADKIIPAFNRLVIFECTEKSYHGVPDIIKLKDINDMRKSLIMSYMSTSEPNDRKLGRKRAKFVARPTDLKDEKTEKLRQERTMVDQTNSHRFM
jgi:hypothetical protein